MLAVACLPVAWVTWLGIRYLAWARDTVRSGWAAGLGTGIFIAAAVLWLLAWLSLRARSARRCGPAGESSAADPPSAADRARPGGRNRAVRAGATAAGLTGIGWWVAFAVVRPTVLNASGPPERVTTAAEVGVLALWDAINAAVLLLMALAVVAALRRRGRSQVPGVSRPGPG